MSRELENFKKSYDDFAKYNAELALDLLKAHPNLVLLINRGPCDFSKSPWVALDNKTLSEFKALAIYTKIGKELLPIMYPGVSFELGAVIPLDKLLSPRKLNPTQITQALDSIKEIAGKALQETIDNRTGFEIVLNFLKACVNFLITIVTFGQKQNFFKSSTFQIEKINEMQQDLHNLFENLSDEEKTVELDPPNIGMGNIIFH